MDSERAAVVDASCCCLNVRLSVVDGEAPGGTQEFGNAAVPPHREAEAVFFARSARVSRAENVVVVFPQMTKLSAAQHEGEAYQIFSCRCCSKELYATTGAGHVRHINFDSLLVGAAKINAAMLSSGYSKAFKIIVPSTPDASNQSSTDDDEDFADSLRQRHEVWLKEEEVRMAARIDAFKRRQMEAFAKLQEKGTSDELQLYQYFQSLATPMSSAAVLGATSVPTAATRAHGLAPAVTQQPDEDEDAQQSDDDTMFPFEGFSNSWEQAGNKPVSDDDDDDDDAMGRVGAGARPWAGAGVADTILGSSLKNGSLPIDIPMNASPGKSLAGSMTRQEQIGSYGGSLVGSLREMSMRSRNEALKRRTSGENDLGTSPSP